MLCDGFSAYWAKHQSQLALLAMIVLSPTAYFVFGYLNKRHQLALVSGWVNVTVAVATVLVGVFLFGDQLTVRQYVGIALAIVALIILLT